MDPPTPVTRPRAAAGAAGGGRAQRPLHRHDRAGDAGHNWILDVLSSGGDRSERDHNRDGFASRAICQRWFGAALRVILTVSELPGGRQRS